MTAASITFDLPPDASYGTIYDPNGNFAYYTMTTCVENAPFVASRALENLSDQQKSKIPSHIKEEIIKGTGLRQVYTIPSILRYLSCGIAAGIALNALTNQPEYPSILSSAQKVQSMIHERVPRFAWTVSLPLAGLETVKNTPFIFASALGTASLATSYTSEELSSALADGANSIWKFTKRITNVITQPLQSAAESIALQTQRTLSSTARGIGSILRTYPAQLASTAVAGLGFVYFARNSQQTN